VDRQTESGLRPQTAEGSTEAGNASERRTAAESTDEGQAKLELNRAKESLSEQARHLSIKSYLSKHPYVSLGAAFLSGVLVGGSTEARRDISHAVVDFLGKEAARQRKGRG